MTTKFKTTATAAAAKAATKPPSNEASSDSMHTLLNSTAMPSPTRQLIASIGQLVSFSASIYWGLQVTGWLMAAAITFTGSGFIGFVIGVVAAVLSFRAAWRAGTFVADLILNFDSGNAHDYGHELRVAAARRISVVRGWFKRSEDHIAV